jgi:hypothetical protein
MFILFVALRAGSDLQLAASPAAAAALHRHRAQGGRRRSRCHHLSELFPILILIIFRYRCIYICDSGIGVKIVALSEFATKCTRICASLGQYLTDRHWDRIIHMMHRPNFCH